MGKDLEADVIKNTVTKSKKCAEIALLKDYN